MHRNAFKRKGSNPIKTCLSQMTPQQIIEVQAKEIERLQSLLKQYEQYIKTITSKDNNTECLLL